MFIYNITVKVDYEILEDWLNWQKDKHIPEIMAIGLFTNSRMFKLLDQDESEGSTYVLQFLSLTKENYNRYISKYAPLLREKAINEWGNRFLAFHTLMMAVQ